MSGRGLYGSRVEMSEQAPLWRLLCVFPMGRQNGSDQPLFARRRWLAVERLPNRGTYVGRGAWFSGV